MSKKNWGPTESAPRIRKKKTLGQLDIALLLYLDSTCFTLLYNLQVTIFEHFAIGQNINIRKNSEE